jgi:hypothetical protein
MENRKTRQVNEFKLVDDHGKEYTVFEYQEGTEKTSAAALSGTVKPALSRPLGVSKNTRIMAMLPLFWISQRHNLYLLASI